MGDAVVHLIDDDDAVRHALAFLLTTSGFAVRIYSSAQAFLDALPGAQPGCVVTDIRMPGMDGLALQQTLIERGSSWPLIVMTGHGDVPLAVRAMKAGAIDFLQKPLSDEALIAAVQAAGQIHAERAQHAAEVAATRARLEHLTAREREVLESLVLGLPNKTIGYDLGISGRTVEVHRASVMSKMGVGSLLDLVRVVTAARGP